MTGGKSPDSSPIRASCATRLKVEAAITNARAYLRLREDEGSFNRFLWQFVGGEPRRNR